MEMTWQSVKAIVKEVMEDEFSMGRCPIARRWEGGTLVIQPADPNLKAKEIPLDVFFKKVTSVREKLRVLEQKLNNHPALTAEDRMEFQQAITRIYGSLTTFNVLFRDDDDKFEGATS